MSFPYTRQNPYLGAFFFLFSKERFIKMAVMDGMAANLESEDQRKRAIERGKKILHKWEDDYRVDYTKMTCKINSALWSAFWIVNFVIALALIATMYLGKISPTLPFDAIKFTTFVGSSLVGWAALMELGGNIPVWDGESFPQLTYTVIFKAIFIPGIFLILMGILK